MSKRKILFALSGLLPLLFLLGSPPDPTLLIYSLFVLVYFFRESLVKPINRLPGSVTAKFVLLVLLTGTLAETFAWTGEYLARSSVPALLHPQLIPDLILGYGVYLAFAISWLVLLRFFRFSLGQVFLTQGFLGILMEQGGSLFIQTFTNPLVLLWWPYILLVFGPMVGLAYILVGKELNSRAKRDRRLKYAAAVFLTFFTFLIVSLIWDPFTQAFLPPPKPIGDFPFW